MHSEDFVRARRVGLVVVSHLFGAFIGEAFAADVDLFSGQVDVADLRAANASGNVRPVSASILKKVPSGIPCRRLGRCGLGGTG